MNYDNYIEYDEGIDHYDDDFDYSLDDVEGLREMADDLFGHEIHSTFVLAQMWDEDNLSYND